MTFSWWHLGACVAGLISAVFFVLGIIGTERGYANQVHLGPASASTHRPQLVRVLLGRRNLHFRYNGWLRQVPRL